jgi:acyl carrier protein phosphodiesterase
MNFLAHLWLADAAGAVLSGAILGDVVRGRDLSAYPQPLQDSIRLHRRIDALTDTHPGVAAARARFPPGARRYAGIVLDVLHDHALARAWTQYCAEPLADFTHRAAQAVADDAHWFAVAGAPAPHAARFAGLLQSYGEAAGIDAALARIAQRLREPQRLLDAARGWPAHLAGIDAGLALLLTDLRRAATGS